MDEHEDVKAIYPFHMNPAVRQIADEELGGTDEEIIYQNFKELLENETAYHRMACASNPYGDGMASKRIADILEFGAISI